MKYFLLIAVLVSAETLAQNFTSNANGVWTNGSTWVGGSAPSASSHGWGTINVNHNISLTGNYTFQGAALNVAAGKTLTITGNFSIANGPTINVYGTMQLTGNATLNATMKVHPGGTLVLDGNATVINSTYLTIGTNAAGPPYANLIIRQNLKSQSSGDITVEQNGRVAVFGNFTNDTGGDTQLVIKSGGQVYVHGNIALVGGGDDIINQNPTNPRGLYVNGSVSSTGGGSATTGNLTDQATMLATNPDFANWVIDESMGLLPIQLLSFYVESINEEGVTLHFVTASEKNCDYFIVESSRDGVDFQEKGRVSGNGTTSETHHYTFVDNFPGSGKRYYRLKSVDYDGYTEVFNVITANIELSYTVKVFPNPVTDGRFTVRLSEAPFDASMTIYDLTGASVFSSPIESNETEVNLSLPTGTYILKVTAGVSSEISRMVVK